MNKILALKKYIEILDFEGFLRGQEEKIECIQDIWLSTVGRPNHRRLVKKRANRMFSSKGFEIGELKDMKFSNLSYGFKESTVDLFGAELSMDGLGLHNWLFKFAGKAFSN